MAWLPVSSSKQTQLTARAITLLGTSDICEMFNDIDAKDHSTTYNTGTSVGGTTAWGVSTIDMDTTAVASKSAVAFADAPDGRAFPISLGSTNWIVAARMKLTGTFVDGDQGDAGFTDATGFTTTVRLGVPNSPFKWAIRTNAGSVTSTVAPVSGAWSELLAHHHGSTTDLYLNGTLIATGSGPDISAKQTRRVFQTYNTGAAERVQFSCDWVYAACRRADI